MADLPTGTVTFLFTDIEGSTALWEQDPQAARVALARHDELVEAIVVQHGGMVVRPRGEGDSRFAVFVRATDAVAAAAVLQRALHAEPWPTPIPMRVRIALHTGEADLRAGDYYGAAVNRCARLRAMAYGGQTLLSQATYDLVRDHPLPGVALRDLGEHRLKDLQRPEHIFHLVIPDLPTDLPSGRTIKGFELREQLGMGSYGEVYRAYQPLVGRDVAIKIIRPQFANHPDFIRRFEAEAQLVARLEHPHIVPLYDFWREPNGGYLVMRWIRGGSLQHLLQTARLELEVTAHLLEQIAAGLAVAHRQHVVHRDLKPTNILLDEDGNAYLSDFGIARDLGATQLADLTHTYGLVDSPAYLAPEQITGEPVTPCTDIYSLGILLYQMLAGDYPFEITTPRELIAKLLQAPLPPLRTHRPDLPPGLDDVLGTATAKDPRDRYPDVMNLLADVRRIVAPLNGVPIPGMTQTGRMPLPVASTHDVENPYKGLRPFREADAPDFFGREALTQELFARLAERTPWARFLAVVGPSGSGKSSVVRAGLIPALRRGVLPGSDRWFVVELFPGAHPLHELESALLRVAVNPPATLLEQLQQDEHGLSRAIKRVLPADEVTELVLIVDQFEELFTLVEDEAERTHMLNSLAAAVTTPHSRVRVVITLRADFYDRPLLYSGFSELVRQRTAVVVPLTVEELRRAIVNPAERAGILLEAGLVTAIVADVGEQPGTLPLLQYTLTELFERREGQTLTLAAYRASGGVLGALARRADELYADLNAEQQAAARQLFLRLVALGEGVEDTRRRVRRAELAAVGLSPQAMDAVIDVFGLHRLLSFDVDPVTREPTVEVAHEALIRAWGQLRAWLMEDRAGLRLHRQLTAAAQEWESLERDPEQLYRGVRLAQALEWAATYGNELNMLESAFLAASEAQARQEAAERDTQRQRELEAARQLAEAEQRRAAAQSRAAAQLRRRAVYLAVALVLAAAGAIGAALFAQRARTSFITSERLRLAAEATSLLGVGESGELPALLAMRSLRSGYTPQADAALLEALARGFARRRIVEIPNEIWAIAVSPDGRYLLTGSEDKLARLWDMQTGQEVRQFIGHTGGVLGATFSPDGRYVLTGSKDMTVRLWDTQTGKEVRRLAGHTSGVAAVAYSPDGQQILTRGIEPSVRSWDVATGKLLHERYSPWPHIGGVAYSADGKWALTSEESTVRLRNVQTMEVVHTFTGHEDRVTGVAFSPDGRYVLTGSFDKTARIWDAKTGQQLTVLSGHTHGVVCVAFSPDGRYVLTGAGYQDKTARLWAVETGEEVRKFVGHFSGLTAVTFAPDGRSIVTAGLDFTVRLWDVQPVPEPHIFMGHTDGVRGMSMSADGRYILTGSADRTARLWDLQTGAVVHQLGGHGDEVPATGFSPDGRFVLTGAGDGTVRLWDVQTGFQVRQFIGHSSAVISVAFSPDGRYVLTGSDDATARLWETATGKEVRQFAGHMEKVPGAAFSPDGRYVLTGSLDGTARLWEAQTGREVRRFIGHAGGVFRVAFSPDGRSVLTSSDDKTARLWNGDTAKAIRQFAGHTSTVVGVAFSPDGRFVLTSSADKTARLWNSGTAEQLRIFSGHTDLVIAVAIAPNGRSIVTGSWDETVRLWRVDMQEVIRLACQHLARDFTEDERRMYNITDDSATCPQDKGTASK